MTRVLVIEDEDMVRTTIKAILSRGGFEVTTARNGKEGMEKQAADPATLVITDIIMPDMDGVETTMELKRKYPDVKILAVSGGGRIRSMSFLEHARAMGANGTLEKPFTQAELLKAVAEVMEG